MSESRPLICRRFEATHQSQPDKKTLLDAIGRAAGVLRPCKIGGKSIGITPTMCAIERMGIQAEADVGLKPPVFQIVARFEAIPCKIRDFITRKAQSCEAVDSGLIKLGYEIVVRNRGRAITVATPKEFLAEAALFVDLEDVNRDMRRRQALYPVERRLPGFNSLSRESSDQIDVDVCDPRIA